MIGPGYGGVSIGLVSGPGYAGTSVSVTVGVGVFSTWVGLASGRCVANCVADACGVGYDDGVDISGFGYPLSMEG